MSERIDVMISSTFKDFEPHRPGILDAILRVSMHPLMMEFMPASDRDAIDESLRIVDDAEIYLGIFGFRYGYVPDDPIRNPKRLSITELEYRRAVERDIPRICFFMDKTHPITMADTEEDSKDPIEIDRRKKRLQALKDEIGADAGDQHLQVAGRTAGADHWRAGTLSQQRPRRDHPLRQRHSRAAGSLHRPSVYPAGRRRSGRAAARNSTC